MAFRVKPAKLGKKTEGRKMLEEETSKARKTTKYGMKQAKKGVKADVKESMKGVKYTKKGQPYVIDPKTGRAKFIKKAKK